jgi:ABC-type uncharacterized transport system ATPase subunit/predicted phosphodiesterase
MNLLIISDVHVNDYKNYNYYERQRLYDFKVYAERIVEIAKSNNCSSLVIAGDLIDKPTNRAYVLHVLKYMLDLWSTNFDKIYYILGQHDRDERYNRVDYSDSVLHVVAPNNMEYMDKKVLELDSKSIAFMNFYRDPDLSWIENPVDVFIGHVTLNTNGWGQDIDQSRFKLGICGDIHYPCNVDKLNSVGIQVQRYMGDAKDGTCVVLNLEDLSWNRILIDPNQELFTRYIYTTEKDKEGFSEELNSRQLPKEYRIYNPITTEEAVSIHTDSSNAKTVKELIHNIIEELDLADIHDEVLKRFIDSSPIDLSFKIKNLKIHNFRSIRDLDYDFPKRGTLGIIADNGAGKSSFILALYYALKGGTDWTYEITEGESYSYIQVTLEYQNKEYTIWRATGESALAIDGEWLAYQNKRACEADIYERLPFINYLDSYFFTDDAGRLLGSSSAARRMELLSVYFRLDLLQSYSEIAGLLKSEEGETWNSIKAEIDKIKNTYESYESQLREATTKLNQYKFDTDVDALLTQLRDELEEAIKLEDFIQKNNLPGLKDELVRLTSDKEKLNRRLNEVQHNLNLSDTQITSKLSSKSLDQIKLEVGSEPILTITREAYEELERKVNEQYQETDKHARTYNTIKATIDSLTELKCPNCDSVIDLSAGSIVDHNKLSGDLAGALKLFQESKIKYDQLLAEFNLSKAAVETYQSELTKYNKRVSEYNSLVTLVNKNKEFKLEMTSVLTEINKVDAKITEVKSSISQFDQFENSRKKEDVLKDISKVEAYKSLLTLISNLNEAYDKVKEESNLSELESKLEASNTLWYRIEKYQKLFSTSGEIYRKVLDYIVQSFNSDKFRYYIQSGVYRGNEYNDIQCEFRLNDGADWRKYSRGSKGQKTLCELDFIKNLISNCGLLIMDEFLNFLTSQNQVIAMMLINEMTPTNKIITSQSDDCLYLDDKLMLKYNGKETLIDA